MISSLMTTLLGPGIPATSEDGSHPSNTVDSSPIVADNSEWDEQLVRREVLDFGQSPDFNPSGDHAESAVDDMASSTLSETGDDYFGAAAGAALLRIIDSSTANPAQRKAFHFVPCRHRR